MTPPGDSRAINSAASRDSQPAPSNTVDDGRDTPKGPVPERGRNDPSPLTGESPDPPPGRGFCRSGPIVTGLAKSTALDGRATTMPSVARG